MNLFPCFLLVLLVGLIEGQWIMHTTKSTQRPTAQHTTVRQTTIPTTTTIIGDGFSSTTTKRTTVNQATQTTKTTTAEKESTTSTTKKTSSMTPVPKSSTMMTDKTTPKTSVPTTTRIIYDWFTWSTTTTARTTFPPSTPRITHDWFSTPTTTTARTIVPKSTTPRITHDWLTTPTTTTARTMVPKSTTPRITHDWFSTPTTTPHTTTSETARTTTLPKATTTVSWYVWETLCNLLPVDYLLIDHVMENTHVLVTVNSTCIGPNQVLEVKLSVSGGDRDEHVSLLQIQKMHEVMACGKFIYPKDASVISCGKPYTNNTYYGPVPSYFLWQAPYDLMEDIIVNATVVDTEAGIYWSDVTSQVIMFDPFCNDDIIPPVAGAPALKTFTWWSFVGSLLITLGR